MSLGNHTSFFFDRNLKTSPMSLPWPRYSELEIEFIKLDKHHEVIYFLRNRPCLWIDSGQTLAEIV